MVKFLDAATSMRVPSTDGARRAGRRAPDDGRLLRGVNDSFEVRSIRASILSVVHRERSSSIGPTRALAACVTAPEPATHRLFPRDRPIPDPSKVDNIEPLMNQSTRTSLLCDQADCSTSKQGLQAFYRNLGRNFGGPPASAAPYRASLSSIGAHPNRRDDAPSIAC